jgi:hypothetical protein
MDKNKLRKLLEEPTPEPVKNVKWRAKEDEDYWAVDSLGEIDSFTEEFSGNSDFDYLTGNYYKTREEAEQALEVIKAKGRLDHAYCALVGDWKPDWRECGDKFFIYYDNRAFRFNVGSTGYWQYAICFYFSTSELADQFTGENIADLKTVFNIKD